MQEILKQNPRNLPQQLSTALSLAALTLWTTACEKIDADSHLNNKPATPAVEKSQKASAVEKVFAIIPEQLPEGVEARKYAAKTPSLLLVQIKDLHFSDGSPYNQELVPLVSQHSKEVFAALNSLAPFLRTSSAVIFEDYTSETIEKLKALQREYQERKIDDPSRARQILLDVYAVHGAPAVQALVHGITPVAGLPPGLADEHSKISKLFKNDYRESNRLSAATLAQFQSFNSAKNQFLETLILDEAKKLDSRTVILVAGYAHQFTTLTNKGISVIELRSPTVTHYVKKLKDDPRFAQEMSGVD